MDIYCNICGKDTEHEQGTIGVFTILDSRCADCNRQIKLDRGLIEACRLIHEWSDSLKSEADKSIVNDNLINIWEVYEYGR